MESTSVDNNEQTVATESNDQTTSVESSDRFRIIVAILIALVALIGAVVAWRSALAADDAGDADFAGLGATLHAEQARTLNNTILYEHYRTYTTYLYHNELGNLIATDLDSSSVDETLALDRQKINAWDIATANQGFFPNRYLTQDGEYNTQRELGEAWAEAEQQQDLHAKPHFAEADRLRAKSNWLIGVLIILAISLVLYTLAEGLKSSLKVPRYAMALGGTLFMFLGLVVTVAVELLL